MSDAIILEALARLEHKVDALSRHLRVPMPPPMHFVGQMCPTCGNMIDFQVDMMNGVVVRRCGCKTGKVPSTIPLLPVTQGPPHAAAAAPEPADEDVDRAPPRNRGVQGR